VNELQRLGPDPFRLPLQSLDMTVPFPHHPGDRAKHDPIQDKNQDQEMKDLDEQGRIDTDHGL
jgi:hypothetical protein